MITDIFSVGISIFELRNINNNEIAEYAKAKSEKLRRVEWNVLDWNTPAIEFYKNVGANVLEDWLVVQLDKNGIENY